MVNTYLVFIPVSDIELLKSLGFPVIRTVMVSFVMLMK